MAVVSSAITIKNVIATEGVVVPVYFNQDFPATAPTGSFVFDATSGFFYLRIQNPDTLNEEWKKVPAIQDVLDLP